MQPNSKKSALGTMISMLFLLLSSLASWLCNSRAKIEAMSSNEDAFAICTVALAIASYVALIVFIFFATKILMTIDGRGVAFYVIIAIGVIFIGLMLLLTIPSLLESIKLI